MATATVQRRSKVKQAALDAATGVLSRHSGELREDDCWQWATAVTKALNADVGRAIIQAGTAMFPIYDVGTPDDGQRATHFSYVWEFSAATRRRVAANLLPEMHVWCALPEHGLIVDATLGFQRSNRQRMLGLDDWTSRLPAVFAGDGNDAARLRVAYLADIAAIELLAAIVSGTPGMWLLAYGSQFERGW